MVREKQAQMEENTGKQMVVATVNKIASSQKLDEQHSNQTDPRGI
jgi:hypothetical protein